MPAPPKQLYAIVFNRDYLEGDHWDQDAHEENPDRLQAWRTGDLYSTGTVVADPLPAHFDKLAIDPPPVGHVWDRDKRAFVEPPASPAPAA